MTRLRWFRSEWVIPLDELASKMLHLQYGEEKQYGFILTAIKENLISGKFVEKQVKVEKTIDPFGNETDLEKIIYQITKFVISDGKIGLELIDPPRGIGKFLEEVRKITGLGFFVSEVNVDPIEWLCLIENSIKCDVISINASGIKANENGIAKVNISGINDIREDFNNFIEERENIIDFIKARMLIKNEYCKAELYKNAAVKIKCSYLEDAQEVIRKSLFELVNK